MSQDLDPITLEVLKNALDSIGDEMALTVMRSAYSGIVRDGLDYSTALCDAQGRMVSQGVTTPLHLGSFPDALATLLDKYEGQIYPEDIFIFNDPYGSGGIHLPDIYIIKPIFAEGIRQGFACTECTSSPTTSMDSGGLAVTREWGILVDEAVLAMRSDKRRFPPYGLWGGKPGSASLNIINPGQDNERLLPVLPMESVPLRCGDLFRHVMPGGGGWGNRLERDPERVLEDVLDEKLTVDYVRREYGVVIDSERLVLDEEATRLLRAEMQAESNRQGGELC